MMRKKAVWSTVAILLAAASMNCVFAMPQMAPKTLAIVRNDATAPVTIEFHSADEWKQLQIDAQKDAEITGDSIRVTTTREDKAVVTVALPIQGGKKYRLFWNDKTSMWDFSSAS